MAISWNNSNFNRTAMLSPKFFDFGYLGAPHSSDSQSDQCLRERDARRGHYSSIPSIVTETSHSLSVGMGTSTNPSMEQDTMDESTQRPTKRRKGGRVYSGCATCHQRKIKCDQRRPTCGNCERSRHYICDGFPIDGSDTNGITHPSQGSKRLQVDRVTAESRIFNNANIMPQEDDTAFQTGCWEDATPSISRDRTAFLSCLQSIFPSDGTEFSLSHMENAPIWSQSEATDDEPEFQPSIVEPDLNPLWTAESTEHDGSASSEETETGEMAVPSIRVQFAEFPGFPITVRQLLHHYRTHVCQLMMPAAIPSHNPWLRLYLPIAVQEPQTAANQALLYSILAVSGFNQSVLRKSDGQSYRSQAELNRNKADELLGKIDFSDKDFESSTSKLASLATALTMTTIEVFSGGKEGRWRKHLRTAREIVERTGGTNWWLSDATNATLLQIYRCLRIVSDTCGMESSDEKEHRTQVHELHNVEETETTEGRVVSPVINPAGYTLDVSFGISMKTLSCLNQIVELWTIKTSAPPNTCWWEGRSADLLRLESDLFSVMDDPYAFSNDQPYPSSQPSDDMSTSFPSLGDDIPQIVSEEIRENHLWAFHYSVGLFYRRVICGGGRNTTSPVSSTGTKLTGQYLVSKVLEHLENIDALTIDTPVANTLWPGFIAAVEAIDTDLRHRVLVWFARARRHGIGNIPAAKALVLEVWRRVDRQTYLSHERKDLSSELGMVDWRDVMKERGMYIMLT